MKDPYWQSRLRFFQNRPRASAASTASATMSEVTSNGSLWIVSPCAVARRATWPSGLPKLRNQSLKRVTAAVAQRPSQGNNQPREGLGSPDLLAPVPGGKNATESKGDRSGGSGNANSQECWSWVSSSGFRRVVGQAAYVLAKAWVNVPQKKERAVGGEDQPGITLEGFLGSLG